MKIDVFGNFGDKGEGISSLSIFEFVVNIQGFCKSIVNENLSVCDIEENNFLDSIFVGFLSIDYRFKNI